MSATPPHSKGASPLPPKAFTQFKFEARANGCGHLALRRLDRQAWRWGMRGARDIGQRQGAYVSRLEPSFLQRSGYGIYFVASRCESGCTVSHISLRRMNQGVKGGSYRESVGWPVQAMCAACKADRNLAR